MKVLNFVPGPSEVSAAVRADLAEIASEGTLSISHRSEDFRALARAVVEGLRERLALPAEYRVFFQPSATAAMDTILRNVEPARGLHFVHGAFGERFLTTAREIGLAPEEARGARHRALAWEEVLLPEDCDFLALTQNETSTGSAWPLGELARLRARWPRPLLAVDVVSSLGALAMDWTLADLWFCSVQKCLGLPAGLGLLLVGPRAFERATSKRRRVAAWQSFVELGRRAADFQTVETPNVGAIALLGRQLARWDLAAVEAETRRRAAEIYTLGFAPFVDDEGWRSLTVCNLRVPEPAALRARARDAGFELGSGYGMLRDSCLRIANFPAVEREGFERLLAFLRRTGAVEER